MKNYYRILSLDYSATTAEIKVAYRNLAKEYHPDVNGGNRAKEEMFKLVGEAYEVLSNEDKKATYDLSLLLHLNGQTAAHQETVWDIRRHAQRRRYYYPRYYHPVVYSKQTQWAMAALLLVIASAVLFVPLSLTRYSSEYHYDKGLEYFQNGQYYAALNSLDRSVIDFGTKDVEACLLAGNILMDEYGQYDFAIEYADKGLERATSRGERVQLLYLKGQCLQRNTDYHSAIAAFEQALEQWPEYDSLHYAIGEIYAFRLDEYARGLQQFERLLAINQNFRQGFYGQAYCRYKLKNYAQALADVNKFLEGGTSGGGAYLLKGKILSRMGQSDEACDWWMKAYRMNYGEAEKLLKKNCQQPSERQSTVLQ